MVPASPNLDRPRVRSLQTACSYLHTPKAKEVTIMNIGPQTLAAIAAINNGNSCGTFASTNTAGSFNRARPTSDGSEGAVKARGMTSGIAHIDEDCSGNGRPITEIINAAPRNFELGIRDTSKRLEELGYSKGEDGPMFPDKVHTDRASY